MKALDEKKKSYPKPISARFPAELRARIVAVAKKNDRKPRWVLEQCAAAYLHILEAQAGIAESKSQSPAESMAAQALRDVTTPKNNAAN